MTRAAESGARRIGLMVAMLSTMTAFLIALTPGPARADCGLLGTSCVVDTVEQTAGGAASTVQETVDQTVDDVVTVVEETVDETVDQVVAVVENVGDTVKKTTDEVVDTVDDTVANVNDTVHALDPVAPPPADGPSEQGTNDPSGSGSRPDIEPAVVRPDRSNRSAPTLEEVALVSGTSPASDAVIVTGTASTSPFDPPEPFAATLPDVARALAFPLVLVGLVLGFVAVQNRLDRKDPKLALATTTPDVLTFE
jgi:tetrahydromethanopterin S-methyltransferase subunit B